MGKVKDAAIEEGTFERMEREKEISNMNILENDEISTNKEGVLKWIEKKIKIICKQLETEKRKDMRDHLNMEITLYTRMYYKILDTELDNIDKEDYFYYLENYTEKDFMDCLELEKIHVKKLEDNVYVEDLYCEDDIDEEEGIIKIVY